MPQYLNRERSGEVRLVLPETICCSRAFGCYYEGAEGALSTPPPPRASSGHLRKTWHSNSPDNPFYLTELFKSDDTATRDAAKAALEKLSKDDNTNLAEELKDIDRELGGDGRVP